MSVHKLLGKKEARMSSFADPQSSRRARRAQVYMSGELVVGGASHKVTIRDISMIGAHIVAPDSLIAGWAVRLKRGELDAAATIAWIKGREAGLKFDQPLAPKILETSMPRAIGRSISKTTGP